MKQEPLYEMIYQDLSQAIAKGQYEVGDRLPSEKELSIQYNVSRITSKKALEMLAEEGRIIRMAGKGSFVSEPETGSRGECASVQKAEETENLQGFIGVILEDFGSGFGAALLNHMEKECQAQGYHMMLRCTRGCIEAETKAIEQIRSMGAAGILMMCVQDETYNAKVLQMVVDGFPVVTVDRQLKGLPVPHIGTDNVAAARDLTTNLLREGCHNICFVKPDARETSTLLDRQSGFIAAMNDHGLVIDESCWITDLKGTLPTAYLEGRKEGQDCRRESMVEQDIKRIDEYLSQYPDTDGFLAAEYSIARIIHKCLEKRGRSNTCRVVCFDGMEDVFNEGAFTHIRQDEAAMGQQSVQLLLDVIRGNDVQKTILVPYLLKPAQLG